MVVFCCLSNCTFSFVCLYFLSIFYCRRARNFAVMSHVLTRWSDRSLCNCLPLAIVLSVIMINCCSWVTFYCLLIALLLVQLFFLSVKGLITLQRVTNTRCTNCVFVHIYTFGYVIKSNLLVWDFIILLFFSCFVIIGSNFTRWCAVQ